MRFDKYLPCPMLQPFVKHYAISESDNTLTYKVIPGSSVVLGIQYRGSLSKVTSKPQPLSAAGITGLLDSYRLFQNTEDTATILVFFTEIGASHFFTVPIHELFSESISLDIFVAASVLENVKEQLSEAVSDCTRIGIIDHFLLSQLQGRNTDMLVQSAVNLIIASNGKLRIGELSQRLYISQSPLEKRFRSIVGATPKKFSSIIRLQTALQNYGEGENLTELGYSAGYFDQSHFIKDFKKFTGETPEKFFANIK